MRWLLSLVAAVTSAGCMNLTYQQMLQEPGRHDSVAVVVGLGGIGDLALGAAGAGIHAAADDELGFTKLAPIYALPLIALDLIVVLIRIDRHRT